MLSQEHGIANKNNYQIDIVKNNIMYFTIKIKLKLQLI